MIIAFIYGERVRPVAKAFWNVMGFRPVWNATRELFGVLRTRMSLLVFMVLPPVTASFSVAGLGRYRVGELPGPSWLWTAKNSDFSGWLLYNLAHFPLTIFGTFLSVAFLAGLDSESSSGANYARIGYRVAIERSRAIAVATTVSYSTLTMASLSARYLGMLGNVVDLVASPFVFIGFFYVNTVFATEPATAGEAIDKSLRLAQRTWKPLIGWILLIGLVLVIAIVSEIIALVQIDADSWNEFFRNPFGLGLIAFTTLAAIALNVLVTLVTFALYRQATAKPVKARRAQTHSPKSRPVRRAR